MLLNIDKLNELLIEKNMNYTELSNKTKIPKNSLSRIIHTENPKVQLKTISAISKALGVHYKELCL